VNDSGSNKSSSGRSEEEFILGIGADKPFPRFRSLLRILGHGESWCKLQALEEATPAATLAAVNITLAMIQAAVKATLASVRKRLSLEYALTHQFLDLGPSCSIEGTGRVSVSFKHW